MGMIKTDSELTHSKQKVAEYKLTDKKIPKDVDSTLSQSALIAANGFVDGIQNEIDEYEDIKNNKNIPKYMLNIKNIGLLLIGLRIKNNVSQEELSLKINREKEYISKREYNDHYGINNYQIIEILDALGETLSLNID